MNALSSGRALHVEEKECLPAQLPDIFTVCECNAGFYFSFITGKDKALYAFRNWTVSVSVRVCDWNDLMVVVANGHFNGEEGSKLN